MNMKFLLLAGAGLVGVYLVATRMGGSADTSSETSDGGSSLIFGGAGGFNVGQTSQGSAADILGGLSGALTNQANLDYSLGIAKVNADKELGLAQIGSDTTLGLSSNALTAQAQSKELLLAMSQTGMSGFSTKLGDLEISSTALYTDTTKNLALATGYNAKGDLTGPDGRILMQSGQSKYDMASYTNSAGVKQLAPIAPLSAFSINANPQNSTPSPTRYTNEKQKQNLGTPGTDYRPRA